MAKLILKYDFTNGKGNDLSGNGYNISPYYTTFDKYGAYLDGLKSYIGASFKSNNPIPINKPYTIKCKINPQRSTAGTIVTTTDNSINGMQIAMGVTGKKDIIFFGEKWNDKWVNNTYDNPDKAMHIPNLYDGNEKEILIFHPNRPNQYVTIFVNGIKCNETLIKDILPNHGSTYMMLGKLINGDYQYYKGYIKTFELYDGLGTTVPQYLLLDSITQDLYSYNGLDVIRVGNMITGDIQDLVQTKGTNLESLNTFVVPQMQNIFKIITIQ